MWGGCGRDSAFRFSIFVLVVSKGCKPQYHPRFKRIRVSQPLRALCFSRSRYRPTTPSIYKRPERTQPAGSTITRSLALPSNLPPCPSSSGVGLLSSAPSCLVLAAALPPPPRSLCPRPPPHLLPRLTLLRLKVPPPLASAWLPRVSPLLPEASAGRWPVRVCCCIHVFSIFPSPLMVMEMFKLTTAPSIRPNWPQCPPHCWDQRGETQNSNAP